MITVHNSWHYAADFHNDSTPGQADGRGFLEGLAMECYNDIIAGILFDIFKVVIGHNGRYYA